MKSLILHLTYNWYNDIKEGKKRVEYREYKPYWIDRISWDIKELILVPGYGNCNSFDLKADVQKVHVVHRRNLPKDIKEFFNKSKWDLYWAIEFENVRYIN